MYFVGISIFNTAGSHRTKEYRAAFAQRLESTEFLVQLSVEVVKSPGEQSRK